MDASRASDALSPAASFWAQTFGLRTSSITAAQTSSLAASDANVQAWEEEIASLSNLLAAANRQRNACSRTCIIPAEILSQVFEELVAISPIDANAKAPTSRLGWLTTVHVCQHWRSVARAHSSLWQRVVFTSVPLWDLFIGSAGDKPLVVLGCVSAHHKSSERFLDLIPAQLHRMRELHVHAQASPDTINRVTRARFTALMGSLNSSGEPANHLEVLSLKPTGYTGRVLCANFMKDRATALRHVSLERISLPLGITSSSLTSLELIETHCKSLSILLKTLETIPCLENLTLDHTFGLTSIASITAVKPPIQLPHVRRLLIKNILLVCSALVESMVVHPSAYMEIDASNTSHLHDGDLSDLANALFSPEQFEPTILDLVAYEGRPMCHVIAWGDEGDAGCYGPTNAPHPTPSHPYPWPGIKAMLPVPMPLIDSPCSISPIVLSDFLSQVPKATWGVVTFKGHMHWDTEQVLTALVGANSVTALIIDDVPPDTVAALCSALVIPPSNTTIPLVPALTALHFENIDFGCPAEECDGRESAVHYVSEALRRHEDQRGDILEILALISCSISDEYVEEWGDYVQEVDWDDMTGNAHDRHTDNEEDEDEEEDEAEDEGPEDGVGLQSGIDDLD